MKWSFQKIDEILLGFSLGTGHLTSLRFFGPIGISEICVLIFIVRFLQQYPSHIFKFKKNFKGLIKLYFFLSIFIIAPLVTIYIFIFTNLNSDPKYIISFLMGYVLCFGLDKKIEEGFKIKSMVRSFFIVFIITNLLGIILFPSLLDAARYEGLSTNPNQPVFYGATLILLCIMFDKKTSLFTIPFITYIMILTKSDAFYLFIACAVFFSIYSAAIMKNKFHPVLKILFYFTSTLFLILFIFVTFKEPIINIWKVADEGGARVLLVENSIKVILSSPFFGFGYGSYSGVTSPFLISEAHNTFIDFAMQYGIILPILIYLIIFNITFKLIKENKPVELSFVLAFIVITLFHFTGRHFTFWAQLGIFYNFSFKNKKVI